MRWVSSFSRMLSWIALGYHNTIRSQGLRSNQEYMVQGNVKVQGMGVFFLVMPLAQTWHARLRL
ncbi:MAG: hypothetical protein JRF50_06855 [Deltaproteobacteria bacterium]|nr:hypothetical protein [Deltaproteobacteria bacterium]